MNGVVSTYAIAPVLHSDSRTCTAVFWRILDRAADSLLARMRRAFLLRKTPLGVAAESRPQRRRSGQLRVGK